MTEKELCETIFQDLFNGNYNKNNPMELLQRHLSVETSESPQKTLQKNYETGFYDKVLQIFSQKTINREFYLQWIEFMYEYL